MTGRGLAIICWAGRTELGDTTGPKEVPCLPTEEFPRTKRGPGVDKEKDIQLQQDLGQLRGGEPVGVQSSNSEIGRV